MEKTTKKVNVCFIANYYKTDLFLEVAKRLSRHNITIFWIIPNRKQYEALNEEYPTEHLLYIGKTQVLSYSGEPLHHDFKINELVHGDRVLREESASWTYKYLFNLQPIMANFIKLNHINYVFGEITWAHEILAFRIANGLPELNCKFINPHTIRIPNGRFAFFSDEFQSVIIKGKRIIPNESSEKVKSIEVEKPAYLALNDKILSKKGTLAYNLKLVKNFIFRTNQDKEDPTLYGNPFNQFKVKTSEIINRIIFKNFVKEIDYKDVPKDKKKILFTLHKQPEASIDVIGRYYEDQFELIVNVWRVLPPNYILLVKEHSNAIGDRTYDFYKKIKQLKNTYLVNNKENSHTILPDVEAVFTVSGTIAYEAALTGNYAFTFAPTFFNKLSHCEEVSWKVFRNSNSLTDLMDKNRKSNVEEFSHWLMEHSYQGIISDSYGDPRCMAEENIEHIAIAILKII